MVIRFYLTINRQNRFKFLQFLKLVHNKFCRFSLPTLIVAVYILNLNGSQIEFNDIWALIFLLILLNMNFSSMFILLSVLDGLHFTHKNLMLLAYILISEKSLTTSSSILDDFFNHLRVCYQILLGVLSSKIIKFCSLVQKWWYQLF